MAPGPATCQLGLPQPDWRPQPGYKSRVPGTLTQPPKEAGEPPPGGGPSQAWGLDIFLPLAWLGLRACCFSASSVLDFLTIKMSMFALDPGGNPPYPCLGCGL